MDHIEENSESNDHNRGQFSPNFRDVTRYNLDLALSEIKTVVPGASFISLDTEFTGLGSMQKMNAKNLDERYSSMKEIASTRSVVSFGICVFTEIEDVQWKYNVSCYNFLTLSYGESMVAEPASLEFLVNNGFSIDRLVKEGAPYIVNHEPSAQGRDINTSKLLREVLESIIRSRKPIIVHNGLLDLMFLYQKFYNDLPQEMEIFLSDLSEMFPGGIYDTKTIAEYMSAEKASYLKYLFKKYEREQSRLKADSQPCVSCEDLSAPLDLRSPHPPPLPKHPGKKHSGRMGYPNTGKPYCEQYALHGHCPARHSSCHKSHDLDFILDYDEGIISEVPSSKRFKGQAEQRRADPPAPSQHTSHSACYDAFMTGYVFSVQKLLAGYEHYINKMYLMNKQIPLVVKKSIYSTTSNAHRKSLTRILNLKPQKDKKINTVDS